MEIRHKKSNEIHYVSLDEWKKLGELNMQSGYKVLTTDDIQSHKIELKDMKPLIEKIELEESLETAIYKDDFDPSKFTVKVIKAFLKKNPDKVKYFANDKRSSIK